MSCHYKFVNVLYVLKKIMVSIFPKCIMPWLWVTAEKVWNETIGEDS